MYETFLISSMLKPFAQWTVNNNILALGSRNIISWASACLFLPLHENAPSNNFIFKPAYVVNIEKGKVICAAPTNVCLTFEEKADDAVDQL